MASLPGSFNSARLDAGGARLALDPFRAESGAPFMGAAGWQSFERSGPFFGGSSKSTQRLPEDIQAGQPASGEGRPSLLADQTRHRSKRPESFDEHSSGGGQEPPAIGDFNPEPFRCSRGSHGKRLRARLLRRAPHARPRPDSSPSLRCHSLASWKAGENPAFHASVAQPKIITAAAGMAVQTSGRKRYSLDTVIHIG